MPRRAILSLCSALLVSCTGIHPHGQLKNVMEGKLFQSPDMTEEKDRENAQRTHEQQIPPLKDTGDVQFRIPL